MLDRQRLQRIRNIERDSYTSPPQLIEQRIHFDQPAARNIDQKRPIHQQGQTTLVKHPSSLRRQSRAYNNHRTRRN
jgi:hypothetical protein